MVYKGLGLELFVWIWVKDGVVFRRQIYFACSRWNACDARRRPELS